MRRSTYASQRCGAHRQDGSPCGAWAIHGARVCGMHGGRAPQVRLAAEERIRALVQPSLDRIQRTIDDDANPQLALTAARDILDRAGYKAAEKLETSGDTTIRVQYADVAVPLMRLADERGNGHAD
jgi:hypothetical protein